MADPARPPLGPDTATPDVPADDWILSALYDHGPAVMFVLCLASCIALPVPASIAMISAGAAAATGGLELWQIALASLAGAIVGDQIAYAIGGVGRGPLIRWIDAKEPRRAARLKAEDWLRDRGGPGVFLSRWPVSPIGPYVNFAAGAAAFGWLRFTLWSAPGEAVWVAVNTALGYVFSGQITAVAMVAQEATGLVLAVIFALGASYVLRRALKARRAAKEDD
ncbi:DedA family protein [Oceanicola sp. 22II-s10i]|uniref:DedA family protein n=1 Tax=Oceanicola sp. 22II-s10i TaxID=1317116 RepID=UPI001595EC8A|nr:VTT domain-containing protein [Oceanicola sp. 22II-s10i]